MTEKRKVYDEQILPLIEKIGEICNEHELFFIFDCQVDGGSIGAARFNETNAAYNLVRVVLDTCSDTVFPIPKVIVEMGRLLDHPLHKEYYFAGVIEALQILSKSKIEELNKMKDKINEVMEQAKNNPPKSDQPQVIMPN